MKINILQFMYVAYTNIVDGKVIVIFGSFDPLADVTGSQIGIFVRAACSITHLLRSFET